MCVPRKLVIYVTEAWPDIAMSKSKATNSDFLGYKAPDVPLTKIKYDSSVMDFCYEIPWQPF